MIQYVVLIGMAVAAWMAVGTVLVVVASKTFNRVIDAIERRQGELDESSTEI